MKATVDIDIACHLGKVRNIDLLSRGFYFIEVELFECDNADNCIAPIRCFSAPSSIISCVGGIQLQPAPLLNMCNVQDRERIFQSRSFMIRYKDECHELNDGCIWRLVLKDFDLDAMGGTAPRSSEPLLMKFKLKFADLLEIDGDIDNSPESFVPEDPNWTVVATQTLCIQCADSATHEYFPVRFSRSYFVELDCMIHCAVTAIKFDDSLIDIGIYTIDWFRGEEESRDFAFDPLSRDKGISVSSMTATSEQDMDSLLCADVTRNYDGMIPYAADLEQSLSNSQLLNSTRRSSSCKPLETLLDTLCSPLICNYFMLCTSLTSLRVAATSINQDSSESCILEHRSELIQDLLHANSVIAAREIIRSAVASSNIQAMGVWSRIVALLPRSVAELTESMKGVHNVHMQQFWSQQVLVHTCSERSAIEPGTDEFELLASLTESINEDVVDSQLQSALMLPYARGLKVFDWDVHKDFHRLSRIVIQQYSEAIDTTVGIMGRGQLFLDMCPARTDGSITVSRETHAENSQSSLSPPHVFVLQHGFLGNHYDMQHLENAILAILPPSSTYVLSARGNDSTNDQSIVLMANNLVREIIDYIGATIPALLDMRNPGKVSFIGHSMGGLVIRKALEHPDLKFLRSRCHLYISLASPHLGTLYADSPLVSAGMWTLLQWRQSAALKELSLQDTVFGDSKKTVLFRLSENGILGWFRKVLVVSSPSDMYVPRYSASLCLNHCTRLADLSLRQNQIIYKMHENLMSQIEASRLIRIVVDNNAGIDTSINTIIGRSAHISYLENGVVALQLIHTIYSYI